MKKPILLVMTLSILYCCCPKQRQVERYMEYGVEVIVNHLEPYKIKGEPSNLIFEEELMFDLERKDLAEIGLTNVIHVDADSEGNIYFANSPRAGKIIIFKFDKDGNYINSFGRRGQGPGEIQFVLFFEIDSNDNVMISDHLSKKIFIFNSEGKLIKEIRYGRGIEQAYPLENGKFVTNKSIFDTENEIFSEKIILCDADFNELKELDVFIFPNPLKGKKMRY